jgi:hypothetical protein
MYTAEQSHSQVETAPEETRREPQPAQEEDGNEWRRTFLFGAAAAGLFCLVGFYNGYPVLTADSGSYLYSGAFHAAVWPFRAPGYGAFIKWTRLRTSTWLTIAAQAAIVVYMLRVTLAHLIRSDRKYLDRCLLSCACALATLTGLPWLVSELMPDVFVGVLFLSAFLLVFAGELVLWQRAVLAVILTISIASHTSLLPIASLYVVALLALRLADRQAYGPPPAKSVLAWLLVPILAAGFYAAIENRKMGLGFSLSPTKDYFLLGRLFGNGMAADYLRQNCPERGFIACRYLSNLPQNEADFMFIHPLVRELKGHDDEIKAIARGAILANPGKFLISSAQQTLRQLVALRTGGDTRLHILSDDNFYFIRMVAPAEFRPFFISKQFSDRLFPLTDAMAPIHTAVFWFSVAVCPLFVMIGRFPRVNRLLAAAIAFLVINAAVCGSLSGAYDRYQSRAAWILPLCLISYICSVIWEWSSGALRKSAIHP